MRSRLVRSIPAILLLAAVFGLGVSSAVGVAYGSTGAPTPVPMPASYPDKSVASAGAPRHCITTASTSSISSGDQTAQCFDTEAEALYAASGGRIKLAPGQTARSLPYAEIFGSTDSTNAIQAILYEHANYGGATLTIYDSGCSIWNNMPAGWNDVTSSVWSGPCGITLYDYPNRDLSGKSIRIGPPGTSYVGPDMNDKASSWSIP